MPLIWLTGQNYPDHNTLWRVFNKHKKLMKKVFRQSVRVAVDTGIVGLVLHAVDGTKIRASCSKRTALHRDDLKELLKEAEAEVESMISEVEHSAREAGAKEFRLHGWKDGVEKREEIKKRLRLLEEEETKSLNPHEPEARMMLCREGTRMAYNAQAVVDSESGLIVGEEVINRCGDNDQLVPMIEEAKSNVGEVAETTIADAGYLSAGQLTGAEEKGYNVLVNMRGKMGGGRFHRSGFTYVEQEDVLSARLGER